MVSNFVVQFTQNNAFVTLIVLPSGASHCIPTCLFGSQSKTAEIMKTKNLEPMKYL